ncbi:LCP family protein [Aeromicrobium duanguangcaii]|uniref:LCP family protein n=1 Tax=Aeromicrobium duanguangcaii TaxID=2968086 RepID=A0ABY5KFR1_9ACTN|nr:LCP family protein [Aeromicrobium duanguangcaii]MCD9153788.1 LCP family protein [Aeromicrobium duanguangcaii]UUI69134.1 LCP family protein [Aeromicrobium duanguangcaii]
MSVIEEVPSPAEDRPRWRRTVRSLLTVTVIVVVLAVVAALGADFWLRRHLGGQVHQLPAAMPVGERPASTPDESMNILLLGSDKRVDGSVAGQRSDTMMVIHVPADRKSISLVSIPRDSWVQVPGHGPAKINAAFSWGGPALAVETIEKLTDVHMDHVAVIDWEGFKQVTDLLGGVSVTIPKTVKDGYSGRTWEAGTYEMDGETALSYVRQRAGLAGGDLDRIKRQQAFLRSLAGKTLSRPTFSDPRRLYRVLDAVTANLGIDEGWSTADMRNLAWSLRSVRSKDISFTVVPLKALGMEGAQSVVYLDRPEGEELWQAVREDRLAGWIGETGTGLADVVD